jgi:hypothetical protein
MGTAWLFYGLGSPPNTAVGEDRIASGGDEKYMHLSNSFSGK